LQEQKYFKKIESGFKQLGSANIIKTISKSKICCLIPEFQKSKGYSYHVKQKNSLRNNTLSISSGTSILRQN